MRRITPFVTLFDTLNDLDGLFRLEPARERADAPSQFQPAVEGFLMGEDVVLKVELPGVDPAKVEVTVEDGNLVLRGEKPEPAADEKSRLLFREIRRGRFERTFSLPDTVDTAKMTASFHNGVLEIVIPAAAREAARTIPIQVKPFEEQRAA